MQKKTKKNASDGTKTVDTWQLCVVCQSFIYFSSFDDHRVLCDGKIPHCLPTYGYINNGALCSIVPDKKHEKAGKNSISYVLIITPDPNCK